MAFMRKKIKERADCPQFSGENEAVSPVVGVMLMLVVTIIIAAVVSGFSSGIVDTTEKSPTASYEFTIKAGDTADVSTKTDGYPIELRVLAGDTVPSEDIQIVTTYTVPETSRGVTLENGGRVIKHTLDGSIHPFREGTTSSDTSVDVDETVEGYPFTPQVNGYGYSLFPNTAGGDGTHGFQNTQYFGICKFEPNCVYFFMYPEKFLGFDIEDSQYGFGEDSIVHITIIHRPSSTAIFDQDVIVEW
jgi:archaeal type IV pilus assembly protein PilA